MIRLFAAIAVPPAAAMALAGARHGPREARWRPDEALHVTLRFFGEVNERTADDLDAELGAVASDPFDLRIEGVGCFGEGERIRALWAGVAESPALRQLASRCEAAARRSGLKAETRNYAPHVTLAYLRHSDPSQVAAWIQANNLIKAPAFRVDRFGLYSSWPGEAGSSYVLEREYRLG